MNRRKFTGAPRLSAGLNSCRLRARDSSTNVCGDFFNSTEECILSLLFYSISVQRPHQNRSMREIWAPSFDRPIDLLTIERLRNSFSRYCNRTFVIGESSEVN